MTLVRKRRSRRIAAAAVGVALLFAGCVESGVDTYDEFRSAVDSGATCEQLIDIQRSLEEPDLQARTEEDLKELGCDSPESTRRDSEEASE